MADYGDFDEPWDDDYAFATRQGNRSLGSFTPGNLTATITTKVPPMFDGTQSWFAYEKAIDEWVDLTELAEEKQGPALKARLEGDAARFKEFLDRDLLKQKNGRGVAYFKETLRARFLKSTQVVFLWRFLKFFEMHRRNEDFHPWLTKMALAFKKLKESWGDVFEPFTKDSPEFAAAKLMGPGSRPSSASSRPSLLRPQPKPKPKAKAKAHPKAAAAATAAASAQTGVDAPVPEDGDDADLQNGMEDPEDDFEDAQDDPEEDDEDEDTVLLRKLNQRGLKEHMKKFPLGDNLIGLMLVAMADLNEPQRLSFTSAAVNRKLKIPQYTFDNINEVFTELFCANKTAFSNPFLNTRSGGKSFLVVEDGEYEEESGYWAIDEDTLEEGFLPEFGETFWIFDGEAYFGRKLTHGRNLKKSGKGKGKFKSKFKSRTGFKPRRKRPGKGRGYEAEEQDQEDYDDTKVDEDTSLAVKGAKGGKGNPDSSKGSPSTDSHPKGGKPKGGRRPRKGKGSANATEDVASGFLITELPPHSSSKDHTLLAKPYAPLRERKENMVHLPTNPTFVILDLGCTRSMGSRKAVNAFLKAWRLKGNEAEILESNASFKFANSQATNCKEKMRIWFHTKPPIYTDVDIVEEGNVPILFSLPQMQNLRFQLEADPENVYLTCKSLDYYRQPLKMSVTKHLVIDLCDIVAPVFQTVVADSQKEVKYQGIYPSFIAEEDSSQDLSDRSTAASENEEEHSHVFVSLSKEEVEALKAKKGYVCDRCDRKWVRTHHPLCPKRGVFGHRRPQTENTDDVVPPIVPPPPVPTVQEASVRRRISRKQESSKRYSDPDDKVVEKGTSEKSLSKAPAAIEPADIPKPQSTGDPAEQGVEQEAKSDEPEVPSVEPETPPQPPDFKKSIQRLHERLHNDLELYKLHIKHYHMPPAQFRRRTDQLCLPRQIYEKYENVCKQCKVCATRRPGPVRSRVTGLRASEFGDLVFVDHTDVKIADKVYVVLVILDAATNLIWATPLQNKTAKVTLRAFRDWMDTHNCRPKHVFGDMAFFEPEFMNFWNFHNVKPIVTGPQTPWPNRAETAIRLFKRQWILLSDLTREDPSLKEITCRDIVRVCSWARNNSIMASGFSPIELATGRRPTPLFDPENATPAQLTIDDTCADDLQDQKMKKLALQAHLNAKQDMDIRADLGRRILPTEGPFEVGERVFYWMQDNNLKLNGKWIPAKVLKHEGPMVLMEDSHRVVKLNQSKVIKDRDTFHDIPLPKPLSQEESPADNPADADEELLKKYKKWERVDPETETFVFSKEGGPLWEHIVLRRTYDRESNLLIAEEYVQHIPAKELGRVLPEWVSNGIRTEFFYVPHAEPSNKQDTSLYRPKSEGTDVVFFGAESRFDVPETFWMAQNKGKIDFLELFAGKAILSYCTSQVGLPTGPPVDINTGYDLNTYDGQQKAWKLIKEGQPEVVYMAVVCGPWSNLQNINDRATVLKKRKQIMPMVRFCADVARYQISRGRKFIIENPETSHIWKVKEFLDLANIDAVLWNIVDMCRHGMKDPASKLPYKKSLCLLHNFPEGSLDPVFLRCRKKDGHAHHLKHERVEGYCKGYGRRSTLSQVYPFHFCKQLAICIQDFLHPKRQPRVDHRQSFLVDDILMSADLTTEESLSLFQFFEDSMDNSFLNAEDSVFVNRSEDLSLRVKAPEVATAQTYLDSLPKGTVLDLTLAVSHREKTIAECARILRKTYFPQLFYHKCVALRGTFGDMQSVLTEDENALVIFWKKHERPRKIYLSQGKHWQQQVSSQIQHISALVFFSVDQDKRPTPGRMIVPEDLLSKVATSFSPKADGSTQTPHEKSTQTEYDDPDQPLSQIGDMFTPRSTISSSPSPKGDDGDDDPPGPNKAARRERQTVQRPRPTVQRPTRAHTETHPPAEKSTNSIWQYLFGSTQSPEDFPNNKEFFNSEHYDPAEDDSAGSSTDPILPVVINPLLPLEQDLVPPSSDSPSTPPSSGPQQPSVASSLTPTLQSSRSSESMSRGVSIGSHQSEAISVQSSTDQAPSQVISVASSARTIEYDTAPVEISSDDTDVEIEAEEILQTQSLDCGFESSDLVIDEDTWYSISDYLKVASNTKSFSKVTINGELAHLHDCYATKAKMVKRKEASKEELSMYRDLFQKAKEEEYQSWIKNNVFQFVKAKGKPENFVTGRWVLTVKRDKEGKFLKCKARWVLRGFQDRQKMEQQTDSPTATRPGFRLACQLAASRLWHLGHIDLKTAFLQGEEYDTDRQVVCQLPPDVGAPPGTVAKLVRPAYGLNDAPRRWWNKIDQSLRTYGMIPTRADRCTYVLYGPKQKQVHFADSDQKVSQPGQPDGGPISEEIQPQDKSLLREYAHLVTMTEEESEKMLEYLLDPITGSPARNREVHGVLCLHVDDLFFAGDSVFEKQIIDNIAKDYQIGSRDKDDVTFTGQHVFWDWQKKCIVVEQAKAIEELEEVPVVKGMKDTDSCSPTLHTAFRSVLGGLNWLQSRTQFHMAYKFSRSASAAAKPLISDLKELNKTVRSLKARPVKLYFWHLSSSHSHDSTKPNHSHGQKHRIGLRLIGYPDASYRNNSDKTSQRGQCIFLAAPRKNNEVHSYGSLIDYESSKIRRTTLSTTVAELYSFMKCYGTCQFLRGLWMDLSGESAEIHMRTDANNLVTTAGTTHLPEQKETIHMIQMMRKELCSGAMHDLAHVKTEHCLSDCLTKQSAKPDNLIEAVETGILPFVDTHPLYRTLIKHKAFLAQWLSQALPYTSDFCAFATVDVAQEYFMQWKQPRKQALACHSFHARDMWIHDQSKGIVKCVHVAPRTKLCVPYQQTCPVPLSQLHDRRLTVFQPNATTIVQHEDNWRQQGKSNNISRYKWSGYTIFWLKHVDEQ